MMADSPTTQFSLLARIRDPRDGAAWAEFVEVYAPLVYGLARRHGLQDADAADLTQEVLRSVARAAPRFAYDPRRGSFRGWLFTVARNQLRKSAQARKRQAPGCGGEEARRALEEQPAPAEEEALWDREYHARLLEWAAERVRPAFREATWQAFWRTAVDGRDAAAVAAELGLSVGAVYIARSRVLARIKEQLRPLQDGDALS
ncbi:MAG TPA: sigma-70 family RNA polymerase sigma factor [Gemmataceae bacterium]|jgi:RNA polymerase sigma-70 factor (ECF subfamily)|nr:sigma-70 family RNA polymerase sigma factor [Gemmataceae bacterium]